MTLPTEAERLTVLRDCGVLDGPFEEFDQIAALAQAHFAAPVALVSFVDAERQWFGSHLGLDLTNTPRAWSFCAHALTLAPGSVMVVEDARTDARFCDNPLVTGAPGVAFYAGALISTPEGHNLGALCVLDRRPRPGPGEEALRTLQRLAAMVGSAVQRRRLERRLAAQTQRLNAAEALAEDYRLVSENTSDVIVRAGLDGKLKFVSASIRNLGHEPADLVGGSAYALVHPDDLERFTENSQALFADAPEDPTIVREHRYRTGWGDWVWMEGRPQVLRDTAGRPVEIINVLRNVTEQRALREEAERAARLMSLGEEIAGVGYWRYDVETRTVSTSRQLAALYGLAPGEAPQPDALVTRLHPDDRVAARDRLTRALTQGEDWRGIRARVIGSDGRVRHLEGSGLCQRDRFGAVSAVFGTVVDVTDKVRQEALEAEARTRFARLSERAVLATEAAGLGVWEHDLASGTLIWDARMRELYGMTADEPVSFDAFLARLAPQDRDRLSALFRAQLDHGAALDTEFSVLRPDGATAVIRVMGRLVRDAGGENQRIVGVNWDVTDLRALEASLRTSQSRYRLIAETSSDIIATMDLDGRLEFLGPSCEAATGFTAEELLPLPPEDRVHPDDLPALRAVFQGLLAGAPSRKVRWRAPHKNGALVWMESRPTLLHDPHTHLPIGFLDVVRDVQAEVEQQEALAQARAEAETAAAVKAEFLSNMSHEIRTPLTAVVGFSDLLACKHELDAVSKAYVGRVSAAARALMAIINDILDFSKLEAGQVEIEPTAHALLPLCREALSMFEPQAIGKGLTLTLDADEAADAWVLVDGQRLTQVLLNLIGNAVKFTDRGQVTLSVGRAPAQGRLRLAIKDEGPGLSQAQIAGLFQRFAQVDASSSRRHGGTGLGLAICKGLVEAMGGIIGVESRPGQGATFFVELPAAPADPPEPAKDTTFNLSRLVGAQVLVVDDNPANRDLVRAVLTPLGVAVFEAHDGQAGLDLLAQLELDAVLLDLRMPGLSGREVLAKIRAGRYAALPVLAFTADNELIQEGQDHQFDAVVHKPITALDLLAALAGQVG